LAQGSRRALDGQIHRGQTGLSISYKRLVNPKVLVNEANAGHVLAPPRRGN
jgi:hypothetical protein